MPSSRIRTPMLLACLALLLAVAIVGLWLTAGDPNAAAEQPDANGQGAALTTTELGAEPIAEQPSLGAARTPGEPATGPTTTTFPTIRVIDETGLPVAGAQVRWATTEPWISVYGYSELDPELHLGSATARITDHRGFVVLPIEEDAVFVSARHAHRYGHNTIALRDPLHRREVRIAPDRTLRLVVTGPEGEPWPNVPIEAAYQDDDDLSAYRTSTARLGRSGADGRFVLAHAQCFQFWHAQRPELRLRALVAGAETKTVVVDVAAAVTADDEIVLPCPPHGGVRVRVRSPTGAFDRRRTSSAKLAPGEVPPVRENDGAVLFHPVAIGRRFQVSAAQSADLTFDGPRAHGDIVSAELSADLQTPLAQMRLRLPNGSWAANLTVAVTSRRGLQLATNDDGLMWLPMHHEQETVVLVLPAHHATASIEWPLAHVEQPITDLGVVQFVGQELIASGRVVDAATQRPLAASILADVVAPERRGSRQASTVCGVHGRFELWGASEPSMLLTAQASKYSSWSKQLPVGSRDLQIALVPHQNLIVTIETDPDVTLDSLLARVRPVGNDENNEWSRSSRWYSGPGWRRQHLTGPPLDDLVLEICPADELPPMKSVPLAEWVKGPNGFTVQVDLRGQLRTVVVELRMAGQPTDGRIFLASEGPRRWHDVANGSRFYLSVPVGSDLTAIVAPESGGCVRATLQSGLNVLEVTPASRLRADVRGLPADVPADALGLMLTRLARREPLLDELAAGGVDWMARQIFPWPNSEAELEAIDDYSSLSTKTVRVSSPKRSSAAATFSCRCSTAATPSECCWQPPSPSKCRRSVRPSTPPSCSIRHWCWPRGQAWRTAPTSADVIRTRTGRHRPR